MKQKTTDLTVVVRGKTRKITEYVVKGRPYFKIRVEGTWLAGPTPDEVRRKIRDHMAGLDRTEKLAEAGQSRGLTVGQMLDGWMREEVFNPDKKKVDRTKIYYRRQRDFLAKLDSVCLADLRDKHIRDLLNEYRDGETGLATRYKIATTMSTALNWAWREMKWISENPMRPSTIPHYKPERLKPWSPEDVIAFRDHPAVRKLPRYNAFILGFGTALREGEILALHWEDVDLGAATAYIHRIVAKYETGKINDKGKPVESYRLEERVKQGENEDGRVKLPPFVVNALLAQRERLANEGLADCPLVFPTANRTFVTPRNFLRDWAKAVKAAGLRYIRFHGVRHTVGSILAEEEGLPSRAITVAFRHKNSRTQEEYTKRVRIDPLAEMAANALERRFGATT